MKYYWRVYTEYTVRGEYTIELHEKVFWFFTSIIRKEGRVREGEIKAVKKRMLEEHKDYLRRKEVAIFESNENKEKIHE